MSVASAVAQRQERPKRTAAGRRPRGGAATRHGGDRGGTAPERPPVDDARQDAVRAIGKALLELRQWRGNRGEGDKAIAPFKVVRAALGLGKTARD